MTTTATAPVKEATTAVNQKKAGPWASLLLAGVFEVGYALSVNGSRGFTDLVWSYGQASEPPAPHSWARSSSTRRSPWQRRSG